jgi:uncharacterized membrane protein
MDTSVLVYFAVGFVVFALARELTCWYFKLTPILKELQTLNKALAARATSTPPVAVLASQGSAKAE